MKSFDISCYINIADLLEHDFNYSDDDIRQEYEENLWKKWKPSVLELMTPDTLREVSVLDPSEMEKYLSSRLPLPEPSSSRST